MVRFILTRLAGCAAFAAFAALSAVPAAAQAVDAGHSGARPLSASQFHEMRGQYLMDDGSRLTIDGARLRPVARLDEQAPVPLQAAGRNRLVSADGRWQLEFQSHASGIDAVTLTMQVAAR